MYAKTSVLSRQNSVSFRPASLRTPFCDAELACYSKHPLASCFCIPIPYERRISFFGVSSKGLVAFIESFDFNFFSISGWGIDLNYCDVEWFVLEMNSVLFEIELKYCISDPPVDFEDYSIPSEVFLPTVVGILVM